MQILIGGYMRYSDLKKKTLDLSGQFMREMPTDQNTKPISQENVFMNRPAVKLSISEEGLEGWREIVKKQQAGKVDQNDEENIVMYDCKTSYTTNYSDLLYRRRTVSFGDGESTLHDEAVDLVHAYGTLYDEIVQGYKNGQREAYVWDPEAEDGLRRLTLDEELAYLDEPFESQVDGLVMNHTYLQKVWKINLKEQLKDMRLKYATGAEREALLREKEEYGYRIKKIALENTLPENTKEKLISATQEFIAQYLKGNGGSVAQILQNIQALSEFRK